MAIKQEVLYYNQPKFEDSPPQKKIKTSKRSDSQSSAGKWTDDQIRLLCELRKQGNSWEDIQAKYFPSRSKHSLEIQYSIKNREMTEIFTVEKDAALKRELEDYQKKMWVHIGKAIGMSAGGCKKRAHEMNYIKKA